MFLNVVDILYLINKHKGVIFIKIPYEHIDKEMIPLIKAMNDVGSIKTLGCCIGHGVDKASDVIFKVTNHIAWQSLKSKLLWLNKDLNNVNIDIYQWHRLNCDNEYIVDWLLKIEVHSAISEKDCVLQAKINALDKLVEIIKDDRASTLPSFDGV